MEYGKFRYEMRKINPELMDEAGHAQPYDVVSTICRWYDVEVPDPRKVGLYPALDQVFTGVQDRVA